MSEIEKIQSRRAAAIDSFLKTNKTAYWKMLNRIRKLLGIYLGYERTRTSIAKDIMNEIFGDIIDGTRAWDMEKSTIEQVLWANINSEVSNIARKEKKYVLIPAFDYEENDNDNENNNHNPKGMDSLINTPPEDIEGKIDTNAIEDYCMNEILKDDEVAQIVFMEMCEDKKQKQIAAYLGYSIEKTKVILRNIRRKISKQIPYHLIENLPIDLIDKILKQK